MHVSIKPKTEDYTSKLNTFISRNANNNNNHYHKHLHHHHDQEVLHCLRPVRAEHLPAAAPRWQYWYTSLISISVLGSWAMCMASATDRILMW